MQPPPPTNEDKFQALNNLVNQQQQQQQQQGGGGPSSSTVSIASGDSAAAPGGGQQQLQIEPVRNLYQPTPKELAYAIYILEKCFPSSLQLFNQSTPGTLKRPISITGQDAVAFLTTSGIHRLILRILWTVVDPNNIGTLIEIGQFHTILRLVALTQAGYVEPELLSVGTLPPPKPTPVQVVWKILNQNTTTVVPLANFNALPSGMPDSQQLQQIYMAQQQQEQQQASAAQQPAQPQPQAAQGGLMGAAAAGAGMMMNQQQQQPMGMAALDALGPATDAPLPALGSVGGISPIPPAAGAAAAGAVSGTATATTEEVDDEEDDFGGFAEAPPSGVPTTVNISSQGMAALDDISVTTAATMQTMATVNTGTRTCTPPPPPPATTSQLPLGMAALDSLMGTATDAPLPGLGGGSSVGTGMTPPPPAATGAAVTAPTTGMAPLDVFGSATDAPMPALGGGGAAAATATTGLGALDALGPAANAPLPSLDGGFGQSPSAAAATTPSAAVDDDDVDFGGFTDASTPPPPPAAAAADTAAPVADATADDDEFGGFSDAPPSSSDAAAVATTTRGGVGGMSAFDALGGIQDAPLPTLGMGQPQSDRGLGLGVSSTTGPSPTIQQSMSFPGTPTMTGGGDNANAAAAAAGNNAADSADVFGMSAFDTIGTSENAPLPSLGTNSGANSHASSADYDDFLENLPTDRNGGGAGGGSTDNPNDMSFGSFAAASSEPATAASTPGSAGKRRSLNNRRRSSRSVSSPETVPKDLMPPMPGEKYVGKVRQNSLRKLPEIDLDFDNVDEKECEDPFAGLDPAPGTLELNEPVASLGPEAETMPKDLQPHSPGERYVPHSKNDASTPGGLQTLAEPNFGDEDDEFGGFTEAPAKFPTLPTLNPASEPDPFSESMPQDVRPHAPGEHYVPHSARASRTPGGLATVGEGAVANPMSLVDMSELNPPTTLSRQETPRPQDLHPHKQGEHYVSHGPPTGLATVGEAFGELVQVEDTKLPGLGEEMAEDDFGDFSAATSSAGAMAVPPPIQLSRQATPAAKDLDPLTKKASAGALAGPSIQEGDEEEDDDEFGDFGGFASAGEAAVPPPTQLSRQATPAAKDLDPLTKKASATPLGGATIQEEGDEEDEDEFGDFGGFTGATAGASSLPPPTQLSRQATPAAKDLDPLTKKASSGLVAGAAIQEGDEEEDDDEFGDFGGFASAGEAALPPPTQLSRQATPAAKDLELLPRKSNVNNNETIFEEEETQEEAGFGAFTAGSSDVMPPPAQLSRQATPAAKDLDQLKKKGASGGALEGTAIQEGDEDEEEGDDFGGFESAGMPGQMEIVAPPQMKRKETPRPQDIKPKVPGASGPSSRPGLAAIGETQDAIAEGAEDDNSAASPDPFAAFDTLASPEATLPPLPAHGAGTTSDRAVETAPSLEATTSLDMFALKRPSSSTFSRQASSGGSSIGNLGSKSTASLLSDDEDDEQSAALRDACRSRSRSPMPDRSRTPIPEKIGVSLSGHTPADFVDTADPGMDQSGNLSDFGDFGDFAGAAELPAPSQLTRQATPAAHDLDPLTKKASAGVVDTVAIMEEDDEDEAQDDFGGFTGASAGVSLPAPTQLSRQATPAAKDLDPLTKKASAGAIAGAAIQEGAEEGEEEDFGDFGGFTDATAGAASLPPPTQLSRQATPAAKDLDPLTKKASAGVVAGAAIQEGDEEEEEEDDFGDFGGFASAGEAVAPPPTQLSRQATPAAKDLDPLTKKASAGAVTGAAIQEGDEEEEEDDFGDFGGFASAGEAVAPPPTQLSRQATPAAKDLDPLTKKASAGAVTGAAIQEGIEEEEEDDFGDFGGFASAGGAAVPPPTQLSRQATPAAKDLDPLTKKASAGAVTGGAIQEGIEEEDEDDFGDFGGFEQATKPPSTAAADDDFGGFAAASAAAPAPAPSDDFGDFASFSAAPAPETAASTSWDAFQDASGKDTDPVQEQMASLVKQLPTQFIQSFDYDNKLKNIAGTSDSKKRTDRSIQVLLLLTSTSRNLVSIWPQVMDVARDELSLGNRLLDEASGLSSHEQNATQKPLATMVAGMGEYVRATRSIVSSLGDMLLLDIEVPLNESTLGSLWGSVSLIKKAWEVEKLWQTLHGKSTSLGLPVSTRLETIVEIRQKCLNRCPSARLCNLSLQPLSEEDRQTTKATVDWGGKPFMACSANFLANKCPFYTIND